MGKRGDGLEELGFAIVTQCCLDYREAYRTGKKNELLKCKSFLESGRVELFTLYTFTGEQIIKDLDESLFKKYGSFEERRKKKVEQYKKKIADKRKQIEELRNQIKAVLQDTSISKDEKSAVVHRLRKRRYELSRDISELKNAMEE